MTECPSAPHQDEGGVQALESATDQFSTSPTSSKASCSKTPDGLVPSPPRCLAGAAGSGVRFHVNGLPRCGGFHRPPMCFRPGPQTLASRACRAAFFTLLAFAVFHLSVRVPSARHHRSPPSSQPAVFGALSERSRGPDHLYYGFVQLHRRAHRRHIGGRGSPRPVSHRCSRSASRQTASFNHHPSPLLGMALGAQIKKRKKSSGLLSRPVFRQTPRRVDRCANGDCSSSSSAAVIVGSPAAHDAQKT